jgi:hypothetical protein
MSELISSLDEKSELLGKVMICLEEGELPLANLVGIGSDGANAMVGWWV